MKNLVGAKAPEFELLDQNQKPHKLSDYSGHHVVLYFYPKDMTSGCTLEAQNFRDHLPEFSKLNTVIIGISCDSCQSHRKFVDQENLNFTLLSDSEKKVVQTYGVWVEKSMYGRKYMGIERETFLINPDGIITKHFTNVTPKDHFSQVLAELKSSK